MTASDLLDPQALTDAACEYDDANSYQTIPERDAAYKGFLAGIRWLAARDCWTPIAEGKPKKPGSYQVTKRGKVAGRVARVTAAAHWDGSRFLNAANVLAWRPLSEPYAGGEES